MTTDQNPSLLPNGTSDQSGPVKPIRTVVYSSTEQDVVEARDQNYQLPENWVYQHDSKGYEMISRLLRIPFHWFANLYLKKILHVQLENEQVLEECADQGFFLYLNHTQEVGDPFLPDVILKGRRYSGLCGPANLSIPVLGKLLPMLGALPISGSRSQMKQLRKEIARRIQQKQVIAIYPEAHVWPWFTMIRPFGDVSFQFPCELQAPCFAATMIYVQPKDKSRSKPDIICHIDGPFFPDPSLSRRGQRADLYQKVRQSMEQQSKRSNARYIDYQLLPVSKSSQQGMIPPENDQIHQKSA